VSAHHTEEEQVEALKRWWDEHGKNTLAIVVVAACGYFGWQGWQANQQAQKEQSSDMYQQLLELTLVAPGTELTMEQQAAINTVGEQIKEQYPSSFYATASALLLAKAAVDADNLTLAKMQLEWAKENNSDPANAPIIDQRLARVLIALDDAEAALALVQTSPAEQFASSFAEVRGDAYAAQNDAANAYAAYQEALDTLPADQGNRRNFLTIKRDEFARADLAEAE
jgi:predicted negative regulator of RcsB-dependent stress response